MLKNLTLLFVHQKDLRVLDAFFSPPPKKALGREKNPQKTEAKKNPRIIIAPSSSSSALSSYPPCSDSGFTNVVAKLILQTRNCPNALPNPSLSKQLSNYTADIPLFPLPKVLHPSIWRKLIRVDILLILEYRDRQNFSSFFLLE